MKTFQMVFALSTLVALWASCTKDSVDPNRPLKEQALQIDMQAMGTLAFIGEQRTSGTLAVSNEPTNEEFDLWFVLRAAEDSTAGQWVLSSPNDSHLDTHPLIQQLPQRPHVELRLLSLSTVESADPQTPQALEALFDSAKPAVPEGIRTPPLSPNMAILARNTDGNVVLVVVKICVSGDDWEVCIEIKW